MTGSAVGLAGDPPSDLIELGVVRGAYGVRGWARVQAHSPDAETLRTCRHWWLLDRDGAPQAGQARGGSARLLEVTTVRRHAGALVAKWRGCENPEQAEALKGARIAVSRSDFPRLAEGQFYWIDLVGARVINRAGVDLGVVQGLRASGAHDLLEVEPGGGAPLMLVPVVEAFIDRVDTERRVVRVDWDPAWLE
ncbi:MAG TPA: ribosome maturation factor RimM [Burkholderiaceae bacterium]